MTEEQSPNIALAHDWITGMRGGEKVLEVFCELFPAAPIHTLIAFPEKASETIRMHEIRTSFLQRMPFIESRYRSYLPLYPFAIERFDMSGFDLILSSSHAVAKGIRPRPGALHISYVHTPMRYVWDMFDQYFSTAQVGKLKRPLISMIASRLRRWDVRTCNRVHAFIANSEHVRKRIQRHYDRDAVVIYPPVDISRFTVSESSKDFYLIVSALVPYKKVELAVEAFNRLNLPLRIIGEGPERRKLESLAGASITFEGWREDGEIARAYTECKALLFPGEEDFGIVPVEAMSCGKPVIAFGRGGATETVIPNLSGLHFEEQTVESLTNAVLAFQQQRFDPLQIRKHAERFDKQGFRERIREFVFAQWAAWKGRSSG